MLINLPYNLREGQVAWAAKVMANFRALLAALGTITVEGLGEGDVATLLALLYQAMVKAGEPGNAENIVFTDGDTLEAKFEAGTLNATILTSRGLFYFHVGDDGHLYVTAADGLDEDAFEIDQRGHLICTIEDPEDSSAVHTYDLGSVRGPAGPAGSGDMAASIYDPNGVGKDTNTYTGHFLCYAQKWGDYFLTDDAQALANKTYYTYNSGSDTYTEVNVTPGTGVSGLYEKLDATEYRLTDADRVSGAFLSDHMTAVSGHMLLVPDYSAGPTGAEAWADARVYAVAQGPGWLLLKALGDIPAVDIGLQATMFI